MKMKMKIKIKLKSMAFIPAVAAPLPHEGVHLPVRRRTRSRAGVKKVR
ncbi:MAG: hypothetical protein HUU32_02090 [Calditrichaceae bacterium]|nr:hypothetical protein [Calditrichia bacterium]NUQ40166.1 hypothetical protein [Calditrichaceae bacterium]